MEGQVRDEVINSVENTNVASSSSPPKYEVFLSFRGEDTRCGFTSHLEKRLRDTKIQTFIDNKLNKGDKISDALIKAIRGSKMSVIVFSVNYATSSWCLDEVLYIVECMEKQRQVVVPVFYKVDPSHVRKQKGSYEAAFKDLKERFEEEKVKQWISALTRVANLSGFPYPSQQYETESGFIDAIVDDILKKLKDMLSSDHHIKDLVGIEESIEGVKKLLQLDSRDVLIIGIWGMGGLGKTTLARAVFKQLSSNFEGCCFLENVREKSGKLEGPEKLKKELFSELLEENDIKHITDFHEERLRRKQVLIVLDDVDQPELLDDLAGDQSWFGGGSRVIITTRDDQVLRDRADEKYELRGLSFECSLELFNLNAFKRKSPTSDDIELSKWVVNYAKGIPLALKVIGRFLSSRRRENWEIELDRLKDFPNKIVQNALKISYDSLDEQEQRVFLDIVCFVDIGEKACRHYVERIVGGGRSLKRDIDSLIDKSLIFEEQSNLRIHDLVREMGWEIVRLQSKEPGERSRLWNTEDCYDVLENNTGTKAIQGISQSTGQYSKGKPIKLSSTLFKEMRNLWFMRINLHYDWSYTCNEERLEYFPSTLKFLEWKYWPFKCMPKSFSLSNLVELRIPHCKLETLIWSEELNNLKHVDLSHSKMLTDVSALSKAPNLESVNLTFCDSLHIVPPLRFSDKSYHKCDYSRCSRVGYLDLRFNLNLEVVSTISGNVKTLNIGWCKNLKQLPSESVKYISCLEELNISECPMLKHLPACVFQLKPLTTLVLSNYKISEIANEICGLNLLEKLDLSGNPMVEIPKGITKLSKLKMLLISNCKSLESLPELPLSLELVQACGCTKLRTISDSRDKLKHEQLSEYHVTRHRRFLYAYCPLSEDTCKMIFEEFQLRVLRLAAKIHLNNFNVEELGHPDVFICIPRSLFRGYIYIREWLTEYSEGPTITVKLSLQWHNATFMGFAICVQFEVIGENFHIRDLMCYLNLNLRKKNGKNRRFEWNYFDTKYNEYFFYYTTKGSSNMLMLYKYENYSSCSDAEEVMLSFSDDQEYGKKYRVTACGIRLLYGQEYEEKFEKSNVVRIEEQRVFLDRLKEVPNKIVQNALKSYDGLDEQEQRVFLDIVCFVDVTEKTCRHYVERIVGGGRSLKRDIDSLIDKFLLFEEQGNLRMHDLVREIGWYIVRHQSAELGEQSRLWNVEDCYNVLKYNTGTKAIQGISQSTAQYSKGIPIELSSTVFKEMCNLWYLRITYGCSYTCNEECLEYFPSTLKFLEWRCWPFKSMPKSFSLSNLVELRIPCCNLETLIWSEELNNLKHVDLSYSKMLTDVSALSKAPNLESVNLSFCQSLRIVPPLRFSDKSYHKCDYLKCSRLGYFDLSFNLNLEVVSIISGNVKTLNIAWCGDLKQLPSESVINISSLEELNISHCQMLKHLPACVFKLKSLTTLVLAYCKISEIANEIGGINLLEKLDLSGNPVVEIPKGIIKLSKLKKLLIKHCRSLELLPELPLSLELVNACGCTRLRRISDSRDKLKQKHLSEYHVTRQWRFLYGGCSLLSEDKLKMIVEEFQLRVLRLAAKIHSNNFNVEELGHPDVCICIPRYKNIQEWFKEDSEGPTITVKLPFQWHNAAFLGFAICLQVEVFRVEFSIRHLMCNLDLRKNNGENRRFEWNYIYNHNDHFDYYTTKGSNNMFMWYKYDNYNNCSDAEELSLSFSDGQEYEYGKEYRVTACGIRRLYGQEYEEKFEKSNVVSIEEPPLKRLRWSNHAFGGTEGL